MSEGDVNYIILDNEQRRTSIGIRHAAPQRLPKLGAHKGIPFARTSEDYEMQFKHSHVEQDGDSDEAQGSCEEVSCPCTRLHAQIAKE